MAKHSHDSHSQDSHGLTGYEAVEFLDIPSMGETLHGVPGVARDEPESAVADRRPQSR